ncbi:MAG: TadE/TadG family type IV pilus assembly protein [Thermoleophilia bacterium]
MRPTPPRRNGSTLVRDESGQGVVEFALILPILLLLLVGILEFGSIYSKVISMRQGVREAGRLGSVGNFGGSSTSCPTLGSPNTAVQNTAQLVCFVKAQAGVGNSVSAYVTFSPSYASGNGLILCAVYPIKSITGLLTPFLSGRSTTTKAQFRIETLPSPPLNGLVTGGDADPTGASWSWCT